MQPHLMTKEGDAVALPDEVYEAILQLIEKHSASTAKPAASIEELETEFAELFVTDGLTLEDLQAEHAQELQREARKLERFS